MCGIMGIAAKQDIVQTLLTGLKRLEYRGYDSAGLAVLDNQQQLQRVRTVGSVEELEKRVSQINIQGHIGIAHTRWATHGKPTEVNTHPHIVADKVALVHNGIIENHAELRLHLLAQGCTLTSDTDSELVAHMVYARIQAGDDLLSAMKAVCHELTGAYAIAMIHSDEPNRIIAIRKGCPLVVGLASEQNLIASDTLALAPFTNKFIYLHDDDLVDIQCDHAIIYDKELNIVEREIHITDKNDYTISKGDYPHFMLKEIYEQPNAIASTLQGRITNNSVLVESFGIGAPEIFKRVERIQIVACGTSYHAGLVAKYWIEDIIRIPCQIEIASEYRSRHQVVEPNTLFVTLSQSGETADTLSALRIAKETGYLASLTICNVPGSSLVRESDLVWMMGAGPEIGVASTKSFTCQLIALLLLCLSIGKFRRLSKTDEASIIHSLIKLPEIVTRVLHTDALIKTLANNFSNKLNTIFIGRGTEFPIALEGALKLKEISYIHAEAYPAGELKHGPLALIDASMPVIALAPHDALLNKLKSNLQEIHARDGQLIIFANEKSHLEENMKAQVIPMPEVDPMLAPIIYVVPLQLLAYYVGLLKGVDVDKPRNLAKSVTVE